MTSEFLSTNKAAELLGVGTTSIKRWADEGRLQCIKTAGGHRRFRRSEVLSMMEEPPSDSANKPLSALSHAERDALDYGLIGFRDDMKVIVYNRKEGRALGEVTKFLVYNARKRQEGGDRAETYFERTECVAGVEDMRFQELMPDVLSWLGVTHIDRFVSMSNMKFDALSRQGITVGERMEIPPELIPDDANVEMVAKRAAGYFTEKEVDDGDLIDTTGRGLHE